MNNCGSAVKIRVSKISSVLTVCNNRRRIRYVPLSASSAAVQLAGVGEEVHAIQRTNSYTEWCTVTVDGVRVGSDLELLEVLRGSAHTTKELGRWRRGMEGIGGEGEVELGRHHKESITGRVLVVGLPRRPQLEVLVELFVHSSCVAGGGSQVFCLLEVVASHVEVVIPHMVLRTLLGGQETMVCHKQVVRDPEITWVGGGVEEDGEVLDVHEGPR